MGESDVGEGGGSDIEERYVPAFKRNNAEGVNGELGSEDSHESYSITTSLILPPVGKVEVLSI